MRLPSLITSSPQRDAPPISACAFTPRTMSALARAGADRRLHVDLVRPIERGIEMALEPADQIGGDEAQHAGFRLLDDEVAEAGNGHAARAALVHHGGDAGAHAHHVGVQAEAAGDVLIDMGVGVDHAGDDDLARDVDHLPAPSPRHRRLDRGDAAVGMPISAMPSRPEPGSITRPPRSSRSNRVSIAMSFARCAECLCRQYADAVREWCKRKGRRMQETVRGEGIGQSVPRLEDDRYLRGKGEFIADIRLRRHARSRLRAQPRRACAHSRHPQAGRRAKRGVRRGGSRRRAADRRGLRPARVQAVGAAGAGDRQGAPCRRGDRGLRRRQPRRGRGPCRRRSRSSSTNCRRSWTCARRSPARPRLHEHWDDNVFLETFVEVAPERFARPRADRRAPAAAHRAAVHVAAGRPRRRGDLGPAAGAAAGLQLDPDAAHRAHRPRRMPRARPGAHPRRRARCRRRLRLQGHPAAGGSLRRVSGPPARPSGALDRGPPRAAHRQRQLPRARLRHHAACRSRRHADRHRRRGGGRCRRLFRLSVLGLPGGGAGGVDPAWPLRLCRPIAAAPSPLRPTSRRSCRIAASRAPASASRWR